MEFVVPFDRSFDAVYGLEYLGAGDGEARGRLAVAPEHLGAGGTVHSGIYASMAESLASTGTAAEVLAAGLIPSGLSNSTHVLAAARDGLLEATARCRARGDLDWLWDVEIADGSGTLCAAASVVIAVRPGR